MTTVLAATADTSHPWYGAVEFRTLAETIPALVFATDANGFNIYTNVQFQRFTGRKAEDLLGDRWLDTVHSDDRDRVAEDWRRSFASGDAYDTRFRIRRFDGDFVWHIVRGAAVRDAAGVVTRWIGSCTDADDLIRGVANDGQASTILAALGTAPDLLIYARDSDGRFIFANAATLEIVGVAADQIIGLRTIDLEGSLPEADVIIANDRRTLALNTSLTCEEQWTGKGQTTRYFRSTKVPFALSEGAIGITALSIEITAARSLRAAHDMQVRHARERIDTLPVITFVSNAAGELIEVNQAWSACTGGPFESETKIANFADIVASHALGAFLANWNACITSGDLLDTEVLLNDCIIRSQQRYRAVAIPMPAGDPEGGTRWYGTFIEAGADK